MTQAIQASSSNEQYSSALQQYFPRWVGGVGVSYLSAALFGVEITALFVALIVVALVTSIDWYQAVLTLSLTSLTLATTSKIALDQPFLLRFVLLSILVVLNLSYRLSPRSLSRPRQLGVAGVVLIIFLMWTMVSAFSGGFASKAIEASLGTALTIAVPLSAVRGRWSNQIRMLSDMFVVVRFLWLLGMIALGTGWTQAFDSRWSGVHNNPNTFAFMSALGFGMSVGLRPLVPGHAGRLLMATFGIGVLASGSRGALTGLLLASALLLVRSDSRRMLRRTLRSLLVVSAMIIILPLQGPFDIGSVIDRTFSQGELDLGGRRDRWSDMLVLIGERPLTGHGLRTSYDALGATSERGLTTTPGAHNSYLTLTAETGVIGAGLILFVLLSALRRRAPTDWTGKVIWASALGAMVAGLGQMIGESFVFGVGSPFPLLFWSNVLIALTCGVTRNSEVVR